ncbi:MAG: hypothetical protein WB615_14885 [Candidatus Tumulicola sp.]
MNSSAPRDAELAAVIAALAAVARDSNAANEPARPASAWMLAALRPELEFDELLALRNACSTRF